MGEGTTSGWHVVGCLSAALLWVVACAIVGIWWWGLDAYR